MKKTRFHRLMCLSFSGIMIAAISACGGDSVNTTKDDAPLLDCSTQGNCENLTETEKIVTTLMVHFFAKPQVYTIHSASSSGTGTNCQGASLAGNLKITVEKAKTFVASEHDLLVTGTSKADDCLRTVFPYLSDDLKIKHRFARSTEGVLSWESTTTRSGGNAFNWTGADFPIGGSATDKTVLITGTDAGASELVRHSLSGRNLVITTRTTTADDRVVTRTDTFDLAPDHTSAVLKSTTAASVGGGNTESLSLNFLPQ